MGIEELKERIREIKKRIESLGKEIADLEKVHKELSKAIEEALNISKQIEKWVQSILDSADAALPDGGSRSEAFAAYYKKGIRDILRGGDIDEAKSSLSRERKNAGRRVLELEDEIGGLKGVLEDCENKLHEFENWLKDLLDGGD